MLTCVLWPLHSVCSWFGAWLRCRGTALKWFTAKWFGHFSWSTRPQWTTSSMTWAPRRWLCPRMPPKRVRRWGRACTYAQLGAITAVQFKFIKMAFGCSLNAVIERFSITDIMINTRLCTRLDFYQWFLFALNNKLGSCKLWFARKLNFGRDAPKLLAHTANSGRFELPIFYLFNL